MKKFIIALMLVILVMSGTAFAHPGFADLGLSGGGYSFTLDLGSVEEYTNFISATYLVKPGNMKAHKQFVDTYGGKAYTVIYMTAFDYNLKECQVINVTVVDKNFNILSDTDFPIDKKYTVKISKDDMYYIVQQRAIKYLKTGK